MYTKKDSERIGNNMRLLRISEGLTQGELCKRLFLTRTTYSSFESGAKSADLKTIDALSRFYNVSFDTIVTKDLSQQKVGKIYFSVATIKERDIMQDYEKLSFVSRNIITELTNTLLSRELIFYADYFDEQKTETD